MKYLLKWMNNAEKEINDAFKPLFNYVIYRQKAHNVAITPLKDLPDIGIDDPTFKMIMERVWNHMSHNHPPAIMTSKASLRGWADRLITYYALIGNRRFDAFIAI